jgi:hypothetical protein
LEKSAQAGTLRSHMATGDIRSKVDAFWSGGLPNPIELIEQVTYPLFLKRLDDLPTLEETNPLASSSRWLTGFCPRVPTYAAAPTMICAGPAVPRSVSTSTSGDTNPVHLSERIDYLSSCSFSSGLTYCISTQPADAKLSMLSPCASRALRGGRNSGKRVLSAAHKSLKLKCAAPRKKGQIMATGHSTGLNSLGFKLPAVFEKAEIAPMLAAFFHSTLLQF